MPRAEPIELNLLREWREPLTSRRILRDALGSLAVHALAVLALILAPELEPFREAPPIVADLQQSAVKIEPLYYEPTQKTPNQGKITHELDSASEQGSPAPRRYRPPSPPPGAPQQMAAPTVIEPLQLENPRPDNGQTAVPGLGAGFGGGIKAPAGPPAATSTNFGGVKQPQISATPPAPSAPKPKPAAESPAGTSKARVAPQPTQGVPLEPGTVSVGDLELPAVNGTNQVPSQCANQTCSALQLLSDPESVDFRPYLQQVLAVVKRNWLTVIPDAAKAGRKGVVVIKFYIQRSGAVSTLSISATSGSGPMDRAAVAGMSMSNPFPPLPIGYKGDEIHLQMAFAYNPGR